MPCNFCHTIFLPAFATHRYRALLCEAGDLTWEAKRYEDPMAPLVATDLEKLEGGGGEGAAGVCAEGCAGAGSRQALVLSFSLPTAAYATMCLRELTKQTTNVAAHARRTLQAQAAAKEKAAAAANADN